MGDGKQGRIEVVTFEGWRGNHQEQGGGQEGNGGIKIKREDYVVRRSPALNVRTMCQGF